MGLLALLVVRGDVTPLSGRIRGPSAVAGDRSGVDRSYSLAVVRCSKRPDLRNSKGNILLFGRPGDLLPRSFGDLRIKPPPDSGTGQLQSLCICCTGDLHARDPWRALVGEPDEQHSCRMRRLSGDRTPDDRYGQKDSSKRARELRKFLVHCSQTAVMGGYPAFFGRTIARVFGVFALYRALVVCLGTLKGATTPRQPT